MSESHHPPRLVPEFWRERDGAPPQDGSVLMGQMQRHWIIPEVERRRAAGTLPPEFKMYQCRVLFPVGEPPRVEFNDEIQWIGRVRRGDRRSLKPGDPVYLQDVRSIDGVHPPKVDGKKTAFLYAFHRGSGTYGLVFSFSPESHPDSGEDWELGSRIAEHLNIIFYERAVRHIEASSVAALQAFGMFLAPGITPYPLTAIADALLAGDEDRAQDLLETECSPEFWRDRMAAWAHVAAMGSRLRATEEVIHALANDHYHTCLYTVYPLIVGLLGDYIVEADPSLASIRSDTKKAELFAKLAGERLPTLAAWRSVLAAPLAFLTDGPFFAQFRDWNATIRTDFPSRHVMAHGKYDSRLFTRLNCIRGLLVLDGIATVRAAVG